MTPSAAWTALRAITGYKTALRKNERRPREEIELMQKRALTRLVSWAQSRSPFYRRLYRGIDPSHFSLMDLPVTDKSAMMDNFDNFAADPRLKRKDVEAYLGNPRTPLFHGLQVVHSGGSSGRMGIVAYDGKAWRIALSGVMRWMSYMGVPTLRIPRFRVASIGGAGRSYASYKLSTGLDIGAARKITLAAADDLSRLIPILNDFRPQLLTGVASVIGALARAQHEGRLDIHPEIIATYAETKSPALQEVIRSTWGVGAFEQYSMIELLSLSSDCGEHRLHISEDMGIVEVVDKEDRPVPMGTTGERILVTNLYNYAMPIIRYRIEDIVTLDPSPCPCGRTFRAIRSVAGRGSDVLELRKRDGGWTQINLLNMQDLAKSRPDIEQLRVVRKGGVVTFQVILRASAPREEVISGLKARFRRLMEDRGVVPPEIRVEVVADFPRIAASGKTRMIEDLGE
jgi:phenylacetate-coenzyme A ligase PaaK-like adenylate-forming protein